MARKEQRSLVHEELCNAGLTAYMLRKFNSRYLPRIILEGEHIQGAVCGRYREGIGFLNWVDRMLIATDHRVIWLNHKPGYTDIEEFIYDVIGGVTLSSAGPFMALTLYTSMHPITLRFVNPACARKFVRYVGARIGKSSAPEIPLDLDNH